MKKIFLFILLSVAMTSCDKSSDYYFKVKNNLTSNNVRVNAWTGSNSLSYDIPVNAIIDLYKKHGGLNHSAVDWYTDTIWEFDSIKIYKIDDGNLIESNKDFLHRSEWTFQNDGEWIGIYTLSIDTSDF